MQIKPKKGQEKQTQGLESSANCTNPLWEENPKAQREGGRLQGTPCLLFGHGRRGISPCTRQTGQESCT